jgi:hypothetical protein
VAWLWRPVQQRARVFRPLVLAIVDARETDPVARFAWRVARVGQRTRFTGSCAVTMWPGRIRIGLADPPCIPAARAGHAFSSVTTFRAGDCGAPCKSARRCTASLSSPSSVLIVLSSCPRPNTVHSLRNDSRAAVDPRHGSRARGTRSSCLSLRRFRLSAQAHLSFPQW